MTTDDLRARAREAAEGWVEDAPWHDIDGEQYPEFIAGYLAHAAQQPSRDIDTDELARVIAVHRIECTGLGEVTCRACRERGWMSWPEFHKHVARAVRDYLTGDESDE